MHVHKVGLDAQHRPLLLLADSSATRMMPIWIGPFEAHAIATHLQSQEFPRPLTHDLLLSVVDALGAELVEVRITHMLDGVFYALFVLETAEGDRLEIDSRPSDAIATAVRADAPILVADDVLDALEVNAEDGDDEEQMLRELLGGLGDDDAPLEDDPEA